MKSGSYETNCNIPREIGASGSNCIDMAKFSIVESRAINSELK
jgi:hypothetical protein